jgi:hypothetical protein
MALKAIALECLYETEEEELGAIVTTVRVSSGHNASLKKDEGERTRHACQELGANDPRVP